MLGFSESAPESLVDGLALILAFIFFVASLSNWLLIWAEAAVRFSSTGFLLRIDILAVGSGFLAAIFLENKLAVLKAHMAFLEIHYLY